MSPATLPLGRFTVLDLTRARAGPTCVRQLVDWGAHAIKVEMPGGRTGDGMGGNRHGFDFQNLHRNKRSMTLNLRDADGVAVFKRLVKDTDIVVENYRPDVKRRLGIDYESLRPINPRLIYGSISGFGQDGPYRDRPGVDAQIDAGDHLRHRVLDLNAGVHLEEVEPAPPVQDELDRSRVLVLRGPTEP